MGQAPASFLSPNPSLAHMQQVNALATAGAVATAPPNGTSYLYNKSVKCCTIYNS